MGNTEIRYKTPSLFKDRRNGQSPRVYLIGKRDHEPNPEMLLTVSELAEKTGYTKGHLRGLLRAGKLPGDKTLNTWLTTHTALRDYKRNLNSNQ